MYFLKLKIEIIQYNYVINILIQVSQYRGKCSRRPRRDLCEVSLKESAILMKHRGEMMAKVNMSG